MSPTQWLRLEWDRALALVLVVIGGLALLLGWLGVSDTAYPAQQLPYILSGGTGGIFLLGLGATIWLSADLRDEWIQLDRIADELEVMNSGGVQPTRFVHDPTTPESANGVRDNRVPDEARDAGGIDATGVLDAPPMVPSTGQRTRRRLAAPDARAVAATATVE